MVVEERSMNSVVIVSAARTPIGRFNGTLAALAAPGLGAAAIRAALERSAIDPVTVDECIMGCVVSAGLGQNPARQAAINGGLPATVGALTINKVCGSGLKAVMLGTALIRSGEAHAIVAGGMESMSCAPYLLPQARNGYRLGHGQLIDSVIHDGLWCAFEDQHMGCAAEWIATAQKVTRPQQDSYALRSHERAVDSINKGYFTDEIVPLNVPMSKGQVTLVSTDEGPRHDTNLAALAKLRPAFADSGSVTAGNAPGLSDGAAALLLMSEERASALGLVPLARIIGAAQAAVPPQEVFTAPPFAIQSLLDRTGTAIDDYDLFEINEAFAAQIIANIRTLSLDPDRVNVGGGAIALGHPIGSSGARVLITLIHALRRTGGRRGIVSLCLGGGEAVAMAIEIF